MGAAYSELGPLGRELAIWEIHLRSTGKSPHTVSPASSGFQAHPLLSEDQGGADDSGTIRGTASRLLENMCSTLCNTRTSGRYGGRRGRRSG